MEPAKAQAMALDLMRKHKVPAKWEFAFDRSRRRHGQAREAVVRGRRVFQITLSKPLVEASDEASVRETILHEIAHVLAGLHNGHNAKWVAKAKQLGCSLTVTDAQRRAEISVAPFKYWCPGCNDHIMVSTRAVSTATLFCDKHPSEHIERVSAKGPEVILSVI